MSTATLDTRLKPGRKFKINGVEATFVENDHDQSCFAKMGEGNVTKNPYVQVLFLDTFKLKINGDNIVYSGPCCSVYYWQDDHQWDGSARFRKFQGIIRREEAA